MTIARKDGFPGLKGLAIGGAFLTGLILIIAGVEWARDELDLPPAATPVAIGSIGFLFWYIGHRLRQ